MMMMMMPSNSKFCRLECSPKKRRLYERLCTDGVSSSFALYSCDKSPALSQDRRLPSPTDRPPLTLHAAQVCVFDRHDQKIGASCLATQQHLTHAGESESAKGGGRGPALATDGLNSL